MDIFNVLTMVGGLCLFLFGMNVMGDALERRAGNGLRSLLGRLTKNQFAGLLTGLGVTAIIQSSSATTVMVVGFVNSGLMTLKQSISVIMGANIGTTVTAWILSLTGISSDNIFISLLKPMSFTPLLALIGTVFLMFCKKQTKKDTGMILLGFATLMFGMDIMSDAVSGLKDVPAFQQLFITFQNPILGVLAGAILTAIIQSSSASVGILQALAATGQVSYGAAIPIIMGQNIGTCVTALISSVGTNKNARRAALVHLSFNIIGTLVCLALFYIVRGIFAPVLLTESASLLGIAIAHSVFNVFCTVVLFPFGNLLEKIVCTVVPDAKQIEEKIEFDERLLETPPVALDYSIKMTSKMAGYSINALKRSIANINNYNAQVADSIRADEEMTDHLEDGLGTYLVKLASKQLSTADGESVTEMLKVIGDFERIGDHAVNILECSHEISQKDMKFTEDALAELKKITSATEEIASLALDAYVNKNLEAAIKVEPLEQVIDIIKEQMRTNHILRMKDGKCTVEAGFVWSDLLTNFERISDHCSNIAGCVIDVSNHNFNIHQTLRETKEGGVDFDKNFKLYMEKYYV